MESSLEQDRIAVVTGAGQGIGRAIALALACQVSKIYLVGRNSSKLSEVQDAVREAGGHPRCFRVDLTTDEHVQSLARSVEANHGRVDILVHAAGVIYVGPIESSPVEVFDEQYRVNVRAPYLLTQALLPMLKRCRGQVVFVNSSAGLDARGNLGPYSATKHALKAVGDGLRQEVNVHGIRVLNVYPGRTATPMQAAVHDFEGRPYRADRLLQPEDVASTVIHALNLPRTAEITDISIRPMMKPL